MSAAVENTSTPACVPTVTCPRCGGGNCTVRPCYLNGDHSRLVDYYTCNNAPPCTQEVPYPVNADGSDTVWPLEFVITGDKKEIVRPSASEFA